MSCLYFRHTIFRVLGGSYAFLPRPLRIHKLTLDRPPYNFLLKQAVSSASQTAADATLALRLAERVASIFSVLDNELQQALVDVPPVLREKVNGKHASDERACSPVPNEHNRNYSKL
jgi:hypothetical protein